MKVVPVLDQRISQAEFAEMVGVSEARISQLMSDGVIPRGATAHDMLLAYCERLRDQAAGRLGESGGGLDLVQERAGLAREQRIAQARKNMLELGVNAPIGLLTDVLGAASAAVVDRFDQLEGSLRKACPDIDEAVMLAVLNTVASARNQWIKSTAKLVAASLQEALDDDSEEDPEPMPPGFVMDEDNVWGAV